MKAKLLLISSSQVSGRGYMDHCLPEIISLLGPELKNVLFIPYAKKDRDAYAGKITDRFRKAGLTVSSIHRVEKPVQAIEQAEAVFIGGGNTFLLLAELYRHELLDPIRVRVQEGMPYFGSSAGSNVAGLSIKTTNDMPIIYPPSFEALGLVSFTINPHYTDPLPEGAQAGETREQRIREFHEWNDNAVVALREKAMLLIEKGTARVKGEDGAMVFRKDSQAEKFFPGDRMDFLLNSP